MIFSLNSRNSEKYKLFSFASPSLFQNLITIIATLFTYVYWFVLCHEFHPLRWSTCDMKDLLNHKIFDDTVSMFNFLFRGYEFRFICSLFCLGKSKSTFVSTLIEQTNGIDQGFRLPIDWAPCSLTNSIYKNNHIKEGQDKDVDEITVNWNIQITIRSHITN